MKTRQPARPGRGGKSSSRQRDQRRQRDASKPEGAKAREKPGAKGGRPHRSPAPTLGRGSELLYGRGAVAEALAGGREARRLLVAEGTRDDDRIADLLETAAARGVAVERPPRLMLDDLTRGANHQGVLLEASGYPYADLEAVLTATGTVLVLDHLQDPQNFGTLLRAAEAAAVAGVIIPQNRSVAVTPAVVNASAGAVEHLRVALVPNISRAMEALKRGGRWVLGLDTGPSAVDFYAADLPTPIALVVGSEGSGLSPNVRSGCDLIAAFPMRGRVASLNAATAGAIALFDLLRRDGTTEMG